MPHKSRNWTAAETTDLVGKKYLLTVTAEFEARNSNEAAHFEKAKPQGLNPAILILDMVVSAHGAGNAIMSWKAVTPFEESTTAHQYKQVTIRDGNDDHTIPVTQIPS